MKLRPNPSKRSGSVILVIIVLVALLIFLGYTLWEIWKMIRSSPAAPANQTQVASGEMLAEFQGNHVGEAVSVVSTQVTTITVSQPFDPVTVSVRISRSTNMVLWDVIATNAPGQTWTDTNAPWPNAFYKQESIK